MNFAPYTPPPPDRRIEQTSYQSGGIPTFGTSIVEQEPAQQSQWGTRLGLKLEVEAACCYALGPFTALLMLIFETENDFVRFHAYQSALLTTPLYLFRLFIFLLHFSATWLTLIIFAIQTFMTVRTYIDASRDLTRHRLPVIGLIAERWMEEE